MSADDAYLEEARRSFWHWQRARGYVWRSFYEREMWLRLLQWAKPRPVGRPQKKSM